MRKCQFIRGFLILEISISILLFISGVFYFTRCYNAILNNYIFSFTRLRMILDVINIIECAKYKILQDVYYFDGYTIFCKIERDKVFDLDNFFWLILEVKFSNGANKFFLKDINFKTGIYKR